MHSISALKAKLQSKIQKKNKFVPRIPVAVEYTFKPEGVEDPLGLAPYSKEIQQNEHEIFFEDTKTLKARENWALDL